MSRRARTMTIRDRRMGLAVALALVVVCGCGCGAATTRPRAPLVLSTRDKPMCDGVVRPWTDDARADVGALISSGLDSEFMATPLGLRNYGAPVSLVVTPPDVHVSLWKGLSRSADVPAPPVTGTRDYWKIEVRERHTDGAYLVREQGTVFPDGGVAVVVAFVCAAYVDGRPTFVALGGFAD